MSMTWPQVRGLNYSTMGRSLRADMWSGGTYTGRVWFAPPTSWRMENASGDVTYIENDTDEYRRADDGIMVHSAKSPDRFVMAFGDAPSLLLQASSMWLPQHGQPPHLDQPIQPPQQVDVRGRTGWQVQFADQNTGSTITYVIDAEIGVALSRSAQTQLMELENPVIDEAVDPELFTWTGPAREETDPHRTPRQREYEAKMAALAQLPRPDVAWVPGEIQIHPFDGDPRAGALDLQVIPNHPAFVLRQWITDVGEPTAESMALHTPVQHRATVGPWTYEIRTHSAIAPDDCERIIASISAPDLPSTPVTEIRETLDREAAEHAEAELRQALGAGERLDDYLGGHGDVSLLIRTDFSDDAKWREAVTAAMAPAGGDVDFGANLTCIDHPENDGLTIPDLLDRIGDDPPYYVFLADRTTITDPEHPILAVDTGPEEFGHTRGQTVRVIPAEMASVEINLSLANMDFIDFVESAGPDGVYRGF